MVKAFVGAGAARGAVLLFRTGMCLDIARFMVETHSFREKTVGISSVVVGAACDGLLEKTRVWEKGLSKEENQQHKKSCRKRSTRTEGLAVALLAQRFRINPN